MKILLNYNFNPSDIIDEDFESLFKIKRRDSCFAFVYQKNNTIYAIRDHLGTVPLYFRFINNEIKFSTTLTLLVDSNCHLDLESLRYFITFGTPKLKPLLKEIKIVPPGSVIKIDPKSHKTQIIYRYRIEVPIEPLKYSFTKYIDKLDELLLKAVKRTCQFNEVGLYLSGGIDSALTGIYLKKLGVKVNAYTVAFWGRSSSEIPFAKINAAKIGVDNHYIDFLETEKYKKAVSFTPNLYGFPHGTTAGIGIASLWMNCPIRNEKQIYAAQGCDTANCSTVQQYISYFLNFLPKFIGQKLHKSFKYKDLLQNYISFSTWSLVNNYKELKEYIDPRPSAITLLSLAGMYLVHTPSDGEVLSGPVINHNIIFSDPFYDMDMIEFFLKIPFKFRVALSRQTKTKIYFDKIIVRKLAERYLPKDLIRHKIGSAVSLTRDEKTKSIISNIPTQIYGIPLSNDELKFRAKILFDWCKSTGVTLNY